MNTPSISAFSPTTPVAFIGGGNMASAIVGGLLRQGHAPDQIEVVEPWLPAREALQRQHGLRAHEAPGPFLARARIVLWAVKPQMFEAAIAPTLAHWRDPLHLSVAAGIRSDRLAAWLGSERIVRAMPNTPALVGKGMTALYARCAVSEVERASAQAVMASTGDCLWVEAEDQLDAVTALSGSGPAYIFYFLEAMTQAGTAMGLSAEQAHQLAVGTFVGASELARHSAEPPATLRARVTSEGGTTHAALQSLAQDGVADKFTRAMLAARQRAHELGQG